MKIFEITLTDSCTRKCPFCYINQTGYYETSENISKFVDKVKSYPDRYTINIFGGEPLLHFDGVKQVVDSFRNDMKDTPKYRKPKIFLMTNADLLDDDKIYYLNANDVNVVITAYDIIKSEIHYDGYIKLNSKLNKPSFTYTFTENDIDSYTTIRTIFRDNGMAYNLHLSHDPSSWGIIHKDFEKHIDDVISLDLYDYFNEFDNLHMEAKGLINIYISRYVQMMFDENMKRNACVSNDKECFFKGEFIGPCIRGCFRHEPSDVCKKCIYHKCCTGGCLAEHIDGNVNDKLCKIEFTVFSAVERFIDDIKNSDIGKKIIQYYHDKAMCIL
jgi:sulfatase maturation enzyme AslB (radical SAM superfamily)